VRCLTAQTLPLAGLIPPAPTEPRALAPSWTAIGASMGCNVECKDCVRPLDRLWPDTMMGSVSRMRQPLTQGLGGPVTRQERKAMRVDEMSNEQLHENSRSVSL